MIVLQIRDTGKVRTGGFLYVCHTIDTQQKFGKRIRFQM